MSEGEVVLGDGVLGGGFAVYEGGEVHGARGELHSALWAHRAGVGAGAAADAELRGQGGDEEVFDADGLGGADATAFAAGDAFGVVDDGVFVAIGVFPERDGALWAGADAGAAADALGG